LKPNTINKELLWWATPHINWTYNGYLPHQSLLQ